MLQRPVEVRAPLIGSRMSSTIELNFFGTAFAKPSREESPEIRPEIDRRKTFYPLSLNLYIFREIFTFCKFCNLRRSRVNLRFYDFL